MHKILPLEEFALHRRCSLEDQGCSEYSGWTSGKAISESSGVRPEARGYGLVLRMCASLQAHTVPVTAHWQLAQHRNEAGQRVKGQEGRVEDDSF